MPFKSEAQRRKFHALVAEGKMDPKTLAEWEAHTDRKRIPDRVAPKKAKSSGFKTFKSGMKGI